jgi:N-acetyl-anhydromuramoyl-L-alanine amidase
MYNKKWIPSPFFMPRGNYPLDMIVIHHIGSQNGKIFSVNGTITWFTDVNVHKNKDTGKIENQVSAHYVIPREPHKGNDVYQLVKDTDIAYHAGESQWIINGKVRNFINRYSIGIEMEGDGNVVEYTEYQYDVLVWLVKDLMDKYKIPVANIVGHEDIAPKRKVDPGKLFDWKKFRTMLNPIVTPQVDITSEILTPNVTLTPEKTDPPVTTPTPPQPPVSTAPPKKEEKFFMEDGSKTHGLILGLIIRILSLFFGNQKTS